MPSGFFDIELAPMKQVQSLVPRCGACGLHKHCQSPKMKVYGKGKRKVLVVGEGPGRTEDAEDRPFVGDSGQRLRKTLDKLDVDLDEDCWTTNAIICRAKDAKGNNRHPTPEEIGHCQPNLIRTVRELQPEIIIPLGTPAVQSLFTWLYRPRDVGGVSMWCGYRIPCQEINAWICPAYHPSFLLRTDDPVMDMFFERHLKRAFARRRRPYGETPDYKRALRLITKDSEAVDWVLGMGIGGKPVSFDFETEALKPWEDAQVVCCAVSNGNVSVAFPWRGRVIDAVYRLLVSDVPKIGYNIKYEEGWCRRWFGRGVTNWVWDGMLAAHVLDNRQGTKSLDFQVFANLGYRSWKAEVKPYLKGVGSYGKNKTREMPPHKLLEYNATDALLEHLLAQRQAKLLGMEWCKLPVKTP